MQGGVGCRTAIAGTTPTATPTHPPDGRGGRMLASCFHWMEATVCYAMVPMAITATVTFRTAGGLTTVCEKRGRSLTLDKQQKGEDKER